MDSAEIGCSLAEAAETPLYTQYLAEAAQTGAPAMHVVYINTSLKTKATAHAVVPTITCTSSNVVQTVLQVCPPVKAHSDHPQPPLHCQAVNSWCDASTPSLQCHVM